MRKWISIILSAMLMLACLTGAGAIAQTEVHELSLSEMRVRITSGENMAIFQLYDTVAAKELYDQLPLQLELTNFRQAQWMFYPPERLGVTAAEAYHDGVKGELSYYAPWGDVFMLYEDFYAGDEMHRLGVCLSGIDSIAGMSESIVIDKEEAVMNEAEGAIQISVQSGDHTTIFALNNSQAAKDLYDQLPMTIEVENYGSNEKIFYPPQALSTADTPAAVAGQSTLAYYAPWGDVVMFYGNFGAAGELYELGQVVSGAEYIEQMSGTIQIEPK